MLVIVTEAVPARLRGYLARWLLEVRAGVYVGNYSTRVREALWKIVYREIGTGNAVLVWKTPNESGFQFESCGENVRKPVEWGGMQLVQYIPLPAKDSE